MGQMKESKNNKRSCSKAKKERRILRKDRWKEKKKNQCKEVKEGIKERKP